MTLFFYLTDLLMPVVMTGLGILFLYHPPKNINSFYGYRTARSMASQEAWDYAHKEAGKLWVRMGPSLFGLILLSKLLAPLPEEILSLVHMSVLLTALVYTIIHGERKLKRRFPSTSS
jgi:uncharacterized membrane protein